MRFENMGILKRTIFAEQDSNIIEKMKLVDPKEKWGIKSSLHAYDAIMNYRPQQMPCPIQVILTHKITNLLWWFNFIMFWLFSIATGLFWSF